MEPLWAAAAARAREAPDGAAVWTPQQTLRFGPLLSDAGTLADALRDAGVAPGRLVALALPNHAAFATGLLALRRAGAVVALVSPMYQAAELAAIVAGADLAALLVTASQARRLAGLGLAQRTVDLPLVAGAALALAFPAPGGPAPALREDAALVKFSSGSTGVPKGIVLTDGNLAAEARQVVATMALSARDRILATVPLCHSYGFDLGVLPMLHCGATLVMPDFFVPQRLMADLAAHRASVFLGVPEMYRRWLEQATDAPPALPDLRWLLSCTAPLDAGLIRAFQARTGLPICQHYGSSETGAASLHVPDAVMARPHSVGRAMHGVALRVVDAEGRLVAAGVEGEVVVASPAVAAGYLMGAADAGALADGRFRTGDLGTLDADGFLMLRGRRDDVINVAGHKVSPAEVRAALERHPAVREAAVIGAGAAGQPAQVWAAVALRGAATPAELAAHCRGELAAYKVPQRIAIVEALPRGASGKVRLRAEDFGERPPG